MKKKVMFALILFMCFIGINNVKAEEGKNKVGDSVQYCEYYRPATGMSIYVFFDMETPFSSSDDLYENHIRLFKGKLSLDSEVEFEEGTCYDSVLSDECTVSRFEWHPKEGYTWKDTSSYCPPHLFYYKLHDDVVLIGNQDFYVYGFVSSDTETAESFAKKHAESLDGFGSWKVEVQNTVTYELRASYGIDSASFSGAMILNRAKEFDEEEAKIKEEEKKKSEELIKTGYGCAVLTEPIKEKINWALNIIKYGGATLAILLGAFDFMKAVLSDEDNATTKAAGKFVKRLIAAMLLFILPLLIQFVLTTIRIEGLNVDSPTCGIGLSE